MSQDIISDTLNQMMNAKKAGKTSLVVKAHSKLLLSILALVKLKGYVKNYEVDGRSLKIEFARLNGCNSIKPRFIVGVKDIDNYVKRYLPAKGLGIIIISTSQGIMAHQTCQEKNIGGSLLAYFY
ncbi:MAG: 30S ribosomal protein S8 [Nanoarchaeota archaeon]|nr:30S ribosomal protein S8 [Nanoarchaeota archaeon]